MKLSSPDSQRFSYHLAKFLWRYGSWVRCGSGCGRRCGRIWSLMLAGLIASLKKKCVCMRTPMRGLDYLQMKVIVALHTVNTGRKRLGLRKIRSPSIKVE